MFKRILSAVAALLAASALAYAVTITGQFTATETQVLRAGYIRVSTTGSLTALAGGAQAGTLLPSGYNVVTTVASAGDSVQLPSCTVTAPVGAGGLGNTDGMGITVTNAAASNSMNVFPQTGQQINNNGANAAYAVGAQLTVDFICSPAGGVWYSSPKTPS